MIRLINESKEESGQGTYELPKTWVCGAGIKGVTFVGIVVFDFDFTGGNHRTKSRDSSEKLDPSHHKWLCWKYKGTTNLAEKVQPTNNKLSRSTSSADKDLSKPFDHGHPPLRRYFWIGFNRSIKKVQVHSLFGRCIESVIVERGIERAEVPINNGFS